MDDLYSFDETSKANALDGGLEQSYTSYSRSGKTSGGVLTTSYDPRNPLIRPKTSANRGAGYSNAGADGRKTAVGTRAGAAGGAGILGGYVSGNAVFDPLRMAGGVKKSQTQSLEDEAKLQLKRLEAQIMQLVDDSALLQAKGNYALALEKAKEAGRKERNLNKLREQANMDGSAANMDITYSCLFNLANQYQASQLYDDSLDVYSLLVKNKQFKFSIRLRVSMGNVYFVQGKYKQAIKMYRMVLDSFSTVGGAAEGSLDFPYMRSKVMENVGQCFIRTGQFQEALAVYEELVLTDYASVLAGYYYVICALTVGNIEQMQLGFERLVSMTPAVTFDSSAPEGDFSQKQPVEMTIDENEIFSEDQLRNAHRLRLQESERIVLLAARVVVANIGETIEEGFQWVSDALKSPQSRYQHLSNKLEIVMTLQYLQQREYDRALSRLKEFELKDEKLAGTAAVNLSFLCLLQGDIVAAKKYAETAVDANLYSAAARTNLGVCFYKEAEQTGRFERYEEAKRCFMDAMKQESVCVEAMYNAALTMKRQGNFSESVQMLKRLHDIVKNSPEVLYQLAETLELEGNVSQAKEFYDMLHTIVPTDPNVLIAIGNWFLSFESDPSASRQKALHYYSEAYRYYPAEINAIGWLAQHHFDAKEYESSLTFYKRATVVEPNVVFWRIKVAACQEALGKLDEACTTCQETHEQFPSSILALEKLIDICKRLNRSEQVAEHSQSLQRLSLQTSKQADSLEFSNYKPYSRKHATHTKPMDSNTKLAIMTSKPKSFLAPAVPEKSTRSDALSLHKTPDLTVNLNQLLPE